MRLEVGVRTESLETAPELCPWHHKQVRTQKIKRAKEWRKALELTEELDAKRLEIDVISYNSAITACERAQTWEPWPLVIV